MITIAGCCLVKDNKILILQELNDAEQSGRWGPPAGHALENESLEDCAIRETFEETGLKVKIDGLTQAMVGKHKGQDYCFTIYSATFDPKKEIKLQKEEHQDYAWASLEDLKTDKYKLRKEFLTEPLTLALTQKPVEAERFKFIEVETD